MAYTSPTTEMREILEIVGYGQLAQTDHYDDTSFDTATAILVEAGRVSDEVLAPLNRVGDLNPAVLENGVVRSSPGFSQGYNAMAEGGWIGMSASPEHGGMGLPVALSTAVNDMMSGACLSLHLNPLLTQGQIEALEAHASDEMKALYLPKLASGQWTGTMNLTESHAGTDVGAIRTKAEPNGDGSFSITGQKIFITWGDHDVAENICHLVLARTPDAPPGTKGISLFMVPKKILDENGDPGVGNALKVVSLEHKLGIHGSPTCVMAYEGATGWLVGAENAGMAAMFTMMNNARLNVGMQGVAVGEAAYQHALSYALERKQGKTGRDGTGTIADHADVRRMLMTMKAEIFAARAIGFACAVAIDLARATQEKSWHARCAFLTPIAKAHGTDIGVAVASLGVQIHGGMGFIEETGAAQYLRDARITPIYEGTNGIQAMDLVARKLADGGEAAFALLDEIASNAGEHTLGAPLLDAVDAVRECTKWMVSQPDYDTRFAGATSYLTAFARVLGGHYHLLNAAQEDGEGPKTVLAHYFIERLLPEVSSHLTQAQAGSETLFGLSVEELSR